MVCTYQDYKGSISEITIEECMELHQMIQDEIRDDEDAEEIYADLLEKALDYIPYRVRWTYKDREWRNRYDESRTMCHDSLIAHFNIDLNTIDYLLLHQANKFIDEKIRRSLKLPPEKVPYCMQDFGNVTNASIPLVMVTRIADALQSQSNHCLACGFGVGLAWGSVEFYVENAVISKLVEV